MGVKDFFRLLQKSCPEVIRELPNRLADLKGKTVAIDGTLLTQRMHFARIPYKNRHIWAWYRLVLDMREAGVNAICVFDSSRGRHIAKQKEVERRRERRRLDEARLTMELDRLDRLRRLKPIFTQLEGRPVSDVHKLRLQINASTPAAHEANDLGPIPSRVDSLEAETVVTPGDDLETVDEDLEMALEEEVDEGLEMELEEEEDFIEEEENEVIIGSESIHDTSDLSSTHSRVHDGTVVAASDLSDKIATKLNEDEPVLPPKLSPNQLTPEAKSEVSLETVQKQASDPQTRGKGTVVSTSLPDEPSTAETALVRESEDLAVHLPLSYPQVTRKDTTVSTSLPDQKATVETVLIDVLEDNTIRLPAPREKVDSTATSQQNPSTPDLTLVDKNLLEDLVPIVQRTQSHLNAPLLDKTVLLLDKTVALLQETVALLKEIRLEALRSESTASTEIDRIDDVPNKSVTIEETIQSTVPSPESQVARSSLNIEQQRSGSVEEDIVESESVISTEYSEVSSKATFSESDSSSLDRVSTALDEIRSQVRAGIPTETGHTDKVAIEEVATQAADLLSQAKLLDVELPRSEQPPTTTDLQGSIIGVSSENVTEVEETTTQSLEPLQSEPIENEVEKLKVVFTDYKNAKTYLGSVKRLDEAEQEEEIDETEDTYSMSRNQSVLSEEEDSIWNCLLYSSESTDESESVATVLQDQLSTLENKSNTMADMFERRRPPDQSTYDESKLMLRALGVPCLDSPFATEGEAYAAALVLSGRADYVASEDTDVIVFEAPLLRGLGSKSLPLLEVDSTQVRKALELQRESFVDLALLCGTDFSQRIKNIGPNRALKLIRKFNKIENLLDDPKYLANLPDPDYLEDIEQARLIFSSTPPMPEDNELEQKEADMSEVDRLLEKYGLAQAAKLEMPLIDLPMGTDIGNVSSLAFQETCFGINSLEGSERFSETFGKPVNVPFDSKEASL